MKTRTLLTLVVAAILLFATCKKDEDENPTGTITDAIETPTTWTADREWVVEGIIDISSDLVIEPGTTVKFMDGSGFSVGYSSGSISAVGTADNPITFTGYNNARWDAIYLYSATNTTKTNFQHCKFSNAGGYGTLIVNNSKLRIESSIISDCSGSAIVMEDGSEFLAFNNNHILNCGDHPLELYANVVGTMGSANEIEAPSGKGILIDAGSGMNRDNTLKNMGVPYYLNDFLSVAADLVISDSVTICFGPEAALEFGYSDYASLKAIGTEEKPIRFTSSSSNPAAGDWGGLLFYSNNSSNATELAWCTIEYGGNNHSYALVYIDNTEIKMNHCLIDHSEQAGVSLNNDAAFMACENNTISNCGTYPVETAAASVSSLGTTNEIIASQGSGIMVYFGNIQGVATWHAFKAPYLITEGLYVQDNAELTLDAGVKVLFGPSGFLSVGEDSFGKLVAQGTTELPVVFSSAAGTPSPGDWAGIYFAAQTRPGSILEHCEISYGGGDYYNGMVTVYECGSNVSIQNNYIAFSSLCGISTWEATPQIAGNVYESNEGGDVCNE